MKRLLILSGKGGTGKTTLTAAFIRLAKAQAVGDCDVDAPNLHLALGRKDSPQVTDFTGGDKAQADPEKCTGCGLCQSLCRFGAIKVTEGKARVNEYSCEGCGLCAHVCPAGAVTLEKDIAGRKELYLGEQVFSTAALKMGRGNSGKLVAEVKRALLQTAQEAELEILDGPPGIGCPVIASVSGVDLVLAVAEPSGSGISDLGRLCKTAETFQTRLAVCVNRYDVSPGHAQAIEDFCRREGIAFLGRIPFDPQAVAAADSGTTVVDVDCPAGRAIREIFPRAMALLEMDREKKHFKM